MTASFSRLAAAGAHFGLFHLTKAHNAPENIFAFGGGLSGHHGKVNDMAFCGVQSEDSWRYVATVSGVKYLTCCSHHCTDSAVEDDEMLMVWDLSPSVNVRIAGSPRSSVDDEVERHSELFSAIPKSLSGTEWSSRFHMTVRIIVSDWSMCLAEGQ